MSIQFLAILQAVAVSVAFQAVRLAGIENSVEVFVFFCVGQPVAVGIHDRRHAAVREESLLRRLAFNA